MSFNSITESESNYRHLEKMSVEELLTNINREDKTVADAIEKAIPQIEQLVHVIVDKMLAGGHSLASTIPKRPLVPAPI